MKKWHLFVGVTVLTLVGATQVLAQDVDQIRVVGSTQPVRGKVQEATATQVTIQAGAQGVKTIPTNEIVYVLFADVTASLKNARVEYANGSYEGIDAALKKLKFDDLSDNGKAEYLFLAGAAAGKLAITKGVPEEVTAAAVSLSKYLQTAPNHYSYYPANELMAELATALGRDPTPFYTKLAQSPWPALQVKAFNAVGRINLNKNDFANAIKLFNQAQQIAGAGKEFAAQTMQSQLGIAEATAKSGKPADAQKVAEQILQAAPPDEVDVYARVYNILGYCHIAAKNDKEALLAFLHVDLLYSQIPDAHAEALYNLSILWAKVGKPDRAKLAKEKLVGDYPTSPWSKKS